MVIILIKRGVRLELNLFHPSKVPVCSLPHTCCDTEERVKAIVEDPNSKCKSRDGLVDNERCVCELAT